MENGIKKPRLKPSDIIYDDGLTTGETEAEIVGYLWATDALVARSGWRRVRGDDQIDFLPVLNVNTGDLRVVASSYENGMYKTQKLKLAKKETAMIKEMFLDYIHLCDDEWSKRVA